MADRFPPPDLWANFWKISVPALPGLYNKTLEGDQGIDPKGLIQRVDEGSGGFLLMGCRLDGLH
jgi:hypothetical protein